MTLPKSSKDFSHSESSIVVLKMIIYNDCMNGFLLWYQKSSFDKRKKLVLNLKLQIKLQC